MEIRRSIFSYIDKVREQKGLEVMKASDDTELIGEDTGLDSLDLAVLVTELEQKTGKDPFKEGFIMFRTVAEWAALYEESAG